MKVDVQLNGEYPKGVRPDLSVDGTIDLEHLSNILYVGRPAYGQADSTVGMFRLMPNGRSGSDAGEVRPDIGESDRNCGRFAGRRSGDSLGHVGLGCI